MTGAPPDDTGVLPGDNAPPVDDRAALADPVLRAHTTPDPTDPNQPPPQPGPDPDDVPAPARAPVEEPRAPQPPIKAG
jgi:hypothetical protein